MALLISDITPVDAVLDRAIPWTDAQPDLLGLGTPAPDRATDDEPPTVGRPPAWYAPWMSALRRLIAEQQSWEIR